MATTRPPGVSPDLRATAPRAAGRTFTAAELEALRPHVILLEDGALSDRQVDAPASVAEFTTTAHDIEEIFRTHLPAFLEEHRPGNVPIVVYAHGGLVDRASGFEIAWQQVDWWKANGIYPIHIVWQTAFGTALWDALGRWAKGRRGWVDEAWDGFLETAARLLGGGGIWNDMKLDAAAASVDGGGAAKLADELAAFMKDAANRDRVTANAVGHSAGSIFHSYFVPRAIDAGVPEFEHVDLLAPAVRIDTFRTKLVPLVEDGRVQHLAVFEMDDRTERDDDCKVYRKSLLYLVAASFEPQKDTPILGMQKYLTTDPVCARLFTGARPRCDLVIAPRDNRRPSASASTSHGGFDNDASTMESVAMRIGRIAERDLTRFPGGLRHREVVPWEADLGVDAPAVAARDATTGAGVTRRVALCIGIDEYPDDNDRLSGCVADARQWAEAFRGQGFDVTELTDAAATRDAIVMGILDLVANSSPGDVLAVQYSGHGTFVPDLDGDEDDGDVANDEALCPVDFRGTGRLVIDDDLARIWDVIPEGVSLTAFFDSCHSGSANRAPDVPPPPEGSRARVVTLTRADREAYRADRGAPVEEDGVGPVRAAAAAAIAGAELPATAPAGRAAGPRREVLLSACRATEVAWESNGHGDFTSRAVPLLAASIGSVSNRAFVDTIVEQFGANRRQTPEFHGEDVLGGRLLLSPATDPTAATGAPGPEPGQGPARGTDRRTAAIVSILRATADLLEQGDG
ncbi:caspase family protein [Agromyces sp. SYSU T0242]|uniref:caspase family protein n=1 Tax=Agromyces litoreus TaxID=3158561 RepID=UPI00339B7054